MAKQESEKRPSWQRPLSRKETIAWFTLPAIALYGLWRGFQALPDPEMQKTLLSYKPTAVRTTPTPRVTPIFAPHPVISTPTPDTSHINSGR